MTSCLDAFRKARRSTQNAVSIRPFDASTKGKLREASAFAVHASTGRARLREGCAQAKALSQGAGRHHREGDGQAGVFRDVAAADAADDG